MCDNAKILGITVSKDLKWNSHIVNIVKKASTRLYFLTQLKRSKIDCADLVQFYTSFVPSLIEYACPVFYDSLPKYLLQDLERIQKRVMRIIFPYKSYSEALQTAKLPSVPIRCQEITDKLFTKIMNDDVINFITFYQN